MRAALKFRAWQGGATLTIGKVEGSLFEPVVIRDMVWGYRADAGAGTRVESHLPSSFAVRFAEPAKAQAKVIHVTR